MYVNRHIFNTSSWSSKRPVMPINYNQLSFNISHINGVINIIAISFHILCKSLHL